MGVFQTIALISILYVKISVSFSPIVTKHSCCHNLRQNVRTGRVGKEIDELLNQNHILLQKSVSNPSIFISFSQSSNHQESEDGNKKSPHKGNVIEMDVSDLNLTMNDLNEVLPSELTRGMTSGGYESTSRIPGQENRGCEWNERATDIDATLVIPTLRGQPVECLDVLFSDSTLTVTAFGYAVWSAILRGKCDPSSASFFVQEGRDRIPVIQITMDKADNESFDNGRWGGFIAQIGEDSIS
mmetsp:Transcript_15943/g.22712  ORF Transcript_15943/g.22712 Transcript_15943/m.22712 type:complete len:242 (-) Transcript_15943:45-770(-)